MTITGNLRNMNSLMKVKNKSAKRLTQSISRDLIKYAVIIVLCLSVAGLISGCGTTNIQSLSTTVDSEEAVQLKQSFAASNGWDVAKMLVKDAKCFGVPVRTVTIFNKPLSVYKTYEALDATVMPTFLHLKPDMKNEIRAIVWMANDKDVIGWSSYESLPFNTPRPGRVVVGTFEAPGNLRIDHKQECDNMKWWFKGLTMARLNTHGGETLHTLHDAPNPDDLVISARVSDISSPLFGLNVEISMTLEWTVKQNGKVILTKEIESVGCGESLGTFGMFEAAQAVLENNIASYVDYLKQQAF